MSGQGARRANGRLGRIPLFALLGANGVSQVRNMAAMLAIPWFVLDTTGSAARTGITAASIAIGTALPPILGGPLVDRLGFKRTSVLSDLVNAATVAAIPLLHLAGVLEFWPLVVLVFLFASLNSHGDTGRYALVPALAEAAAMPRERANAADRAVIRLGQVLGPVVGGFLIALVGASNVLFLDAATFAVSAMLVALGVPQEAAVEEAAGATAARGYLTDLREGVRFVAGNRLILSTALVTGWGNCLTLPLVLVVLPVYAQTIWGSAPTLGLAFGTFGVGALVGTVGFGLVGRRWPRRVTFLACFVLAPLIGYGALALVLPLPLLFPAAGLAGLIAGPINPLMLTVIQENTPQQMLGRVFGALGALWQIGVPFGALIAGLAVERVGPVSTITAMGGLYLAVTVGMIFNPALRRMEPR